jgi:hypothetical protein
VNPTRRKSYGTDSSAASLAPEASFCHPGDGSRGTLPRKVRPMIDTNCSCSRCLLRKADELRRRGLSSAEIAASLGIDAHGLELMRAADRGPTHPWLTIWRIFGDRFRP